MQLISKYEFLNSTPMLFFSQIMLLDMQAFELMVHLLPPEHEPASRCST